MTFKRRLRMILLCCTLEMGALMGVPMRPEEIEELLRNMNQPKVVRRSDDSERGDDLSGGCGSQSFEELGE